MTLDIILDVITHYIRFVIVGVVLFWFFARIFKEAKKKPLTIDGVTVLRPASYYPLMGIACLFGMAMFISPFFGAFGYKNNDLAELLIIIASLFGISGIYLTAFGYLYRLTVTSKEIILRNLFGISTKITWQDIINVSYHLNTMYLTIETRTKKIKAHAHLVGFKYFREMIENKTGKKINIKGNKEYSWPMP